jgi:hypothetical protein
MSMATVKTIRVPDPRVKGEFVVINEGDQDAMKRFGIKVGRAKADGKPDGKADGEGQGE